MKMRRPAASAAALALAVTTGSGSRDGRKHGTLFEYHWSADSIWRAEDLGAIAAYTPKFEPRTHVLDADGTLYQPIVDPFHEVSGPDDAVWRSRVEQYIDLNQFMTHVAIEQYRRGRLPVPGDRSTGRHHLRRGARDFASRRPRQVLDDVARFRRQAGGSYAWERRGARRLG